MGRNANSHQDQEQKASIESHWPFEGKVLKVRQDTIKAPNHLPYIREIATAETNKILNAKKYELFKHLLTSSSLPKTLLFTDVWYI